MDPREEGDFSAPSFFEKLEGKGSEATEEMHGDMKAWAQGCLRMEDTRQWFSSWLPSRPLVRAVPSPLRLVPSRFS